jgi:hypothetical protein
MSALAGIEAIHHEGHEGHEEKQGPFKLLLTFFVPFVLFVVQAFGVLPKCPGRSS